MKVSIKAKEIAIVLLVMGVVFGAVKLYLIVKPVGTINYKGTDFTFREDIRLAEKVEAIPNEQEIKDFFWQENITTLKILFRNGTDNSLNIVGSFELSYKLKLVYLLNGMDVNITAEPIQDFDNITAEHSIVLLPYPYSNKTSLELYGNKLFLYGKDKKDFDIVVIKAILLAMDYKRF